jgi:hypothetical protein
LDYIGQAIQQARARTVSNAGRLAFITGDINQLELPVNNYEVVVSIDSIFFSDNYAETIQKSKLALRRKQVLADLKLLFEGEGNLFAYENRLDDAEGIFHAIEQGLHARYLYLASSANQD